MTAVAFVVPAHGRVALSRACLAALRWTCDELAASGVAAGAVVVADDENLDAAAEHGHATIRRSNRWLGAKINDGIQLAAADGATHVVYLGSDNWLHPVWVQEALERSAPGVIVAMRSEAVVSPDGSRMIHIRVGYEGGTGVRLVPIDLYERLGWRPIGEERERAIDGGTLDRLRAKHVPFRFAYHDIDAIQLVGFHSPVEQLTSWEHLEADFAVATTAQPFPRLAEWWPKQLVAGVRKVYAARTARPRQRKARP